MYLLLAAAALAVSSCQKDAGGGGKSPTDPVGTIPADFDWKTIQDVSVTVAAPVVEGGTPAYSVIGVYASPILSEENVVAKGVTTAAAPFSTAVTIPAGARNLYVQTTLPDGRKAVKMVAAGASVNVPGAAMTAAASPKVRVAATALAASSMPDYPAMTEPDAGSFAPQAVISTTPSVNFNLGASTSAYAADAYYIPAGAVIDGNINLNGNYEPNKQPVLYVKGKLNLASPNIGYATLAILPGGEVTISGKLTAQNVAKDLPALYVFPGGKLTVVEVSFSGREAVNLGTIEVTGKLDLNNALKFYNGAGSVLTAATFKYSNSGGLFNDGKIAADELEFNSTAAFENCENGELTVGYVKFANRTTKFYQKGAADIDEMYAIGEVYVNCYTSVNTLKVEGGSIYIASGAALVTETADFNNAKAEFAAGSLFIAQDFSPAQGGKNTFTSKAGETDVTPVLRFEQSSFYSKGDQYWSQAYTAFSGRMEVVDPHAENKFYVAKCFTDGAYLSLSQLTNIPKSDCNGGKGQITPDPQPEPDPFELVEGQVYTYCFEDNWPWFGDYDMNDVVVVSRIDRMLSKDGSKVSELTFNWELRAAGTTYDIAYGVQMDQVPSANIASAESSHKGFGSGQFASQNPESGKNAVIPFFNKTKELLSTSNTWKGHTPSPTEKHTTKVVFSQPVDAAAVKDSEMNFFIAVKSRSNEVHMPGYAPTESGVIGKGSFLPSDPYKFYVAEGDQAEHNYMMWALMIPGEFSYPAETEDIRNVYKYFMDWAASNGTQHVEWYLEEADGSKIY